MLSTIKKDTQAHSGHQFKRRRIYQYLVAPFTLATVLILGNNAGASSLKINLTYAGNVTQEQKEAAELAALIWEQYITDPITVNIHLDMNELPWGKMGVATPNLRTNYKYDTFRTTAESKAELTGKNIDLLPTVELAEQNTDSFPITINPDGD